MATSNAPAGGKYRDVEHAGQCTLQENAHNFPDADKNCMIPPVFETQYPEPVDEITNEVLERKAKRPFTQKEDKRFTGMRNNASGEEAEYQVHKIFEKLAKGGATNSPVLVIRNYMLKNFKARVLARELKMNFNGIHTEAEFDAVVVVKGTGLILVEVKRQNTENQRNKAEDQLQNAQSFFTRIMSHITNSTHQLPVIKVVMFPNEQTPSPTTKSTRGSYFINKDVLSNFDPKWNEITNELHAMKSNSNFGDEYFRRFVWALTGVWCMVKLHNRNPIYNNDEASAVNQLQHNDTLIKRNIYASEAIKAKDESRIPNPVANVSIIGRPQDGIPTCEDLDLMYLTPEQKDLYETFPQGFVRGSAGTGKTLLAELKIVDIIQSSPSEKVLIIAPHPHHLRLEQFLRLNAGQVTVTETFPPADQSCNVVLITLKNFFDVPRKTLQSYNINMFNVFIDDFQSLYFNTVSSKTTYDDVLQFIERLYADLIGTSRILWCGVDVGQSIGVDVDSSRVAYLFNVNRNTSRNLSIPIFNLNKILRNSVEISTVVQKIRNIRVAEKNASSTILVNHTTGHNIRSETATYHKLINWTGQNEEDWKTHGVGFAVERVKEELNSLLGSQDHKMKLSDIALLYDDDTVEEPIKDMLNSANSLTPQTIEEHIITKKDTIIMDTTKNVASFECAFVIYICTDTSPGDCDHFNIMTRARTKLIIVDIDYERKPPLLTDEVLLIKWEEQNGSFQEQK